MANVTGSNNPFYMGGTTPNAQTQPTGGFYSPPPSAPTTAPSSSGFSMLNNVPVYNPNGGGNTGTPTPPLADTGAFSYGPQFSGESPTYLSDGPNPSAGSPNGYVTGYNNNQAYYTNPNGTTSPDNPYTDYAGSGMSYAAYTSMYGTPEQQASAGSAAGAAAQAQGNNQVNNPAVNPTLPNTTVPGATPTSTSTAPTTGVLSGPGYGETEFQQHGNDLIGQPSNSQSLYDEGISATNPYYQNAMNVTNSAINSAEAARGEGNSGAALSEIGTADANLLGQQALAQEQLAGQADTANTSQYTATMNAANGAENETNNRVNGATSAYTNLSTAQANMVDNFYSMAEQGQLTGDMASIEAQLAASGVDAATAQAIANDLIQVGGIATKAVAGGK